ncbi:CCAAT/enhancer-binding protein zeta [Culicoides brevitarsis]|uniref:CCAAT/enhancer-binding protein zeta n=1 Tax=Culicoides brevitarsis TaxID=469753 RepID=UPI00307B19CF
MGKIYFDDDGSTKKAEEQKKAPEKVFKPYKHKKNGNAFQTFDADVKNLDKRWFEHYEKFNTLVDFKELKDAEQQEILKKCEKSFQHESEAAKKNNPSDSKWLETALHQGTARDKANSGALLVQTNPLSNLPALETLIGQTKHTNKASPDVVEVLSQLFMNSLIPKDRKLMSLMQRGNDWKKVKNETTLSEEEKSKIYAFWYFEEKIRENYMTFIQNLKETLSKGNEKAKSVAIRVASKLLAHGPEKEALLLNILVNKLGDPQPKIASTASYRLMEVMRAHPNMVEVMVIEAEKVLFRDNISDNARHFTLSFLTCLARYATESAANRLMKICFSMFKIMTEKGEINRKMMKLILLCIRTSMETLGSKVSVPDETIATMYRLIHLAEIETSLQTLSVLLEVTLHQRMSDQDRFYSALYKKINDPALILAGNKVANLFFHLFHRAVQNDRDVPRAQAFLKRLLQAALAYPPSKIIGVLVVVNKILKARAPLLIDGQSPELPAEVEKNLEEQLAKFNEDDDEEEVYHDVALEDEPKKPEKVTKNSKKEAKGWVHTEKNEKNTENAEIKTEDERKPTKYDPHKRDPKYSGAQFTRKYELIQLLKHFHPSVQKITEQTINHKNLTYYGDPLRDFSVSTFLDRFSFKNPKAEAAKSHKKSLIYKNKYQPQGSRGISVHLLTKQNCTEEERFIFEFLEKKRDKKNKIDEKLKEKEENGDDAASVASSVESVDDDEFNEYLDNLGAAGAMESDDENIDYMEELGQKLSKKDKKSKKEKKNEEDDSEDDDKWDSDGEEGGSDEELDDEMEMGSDAGSVSFDENELDDDEDDDASVMTFSGDEDDDDDDENSDSDGSFGGKKRGRKQMSDKAFAKKLKSANSESLFAAADDFSEMLEQSSKTNGKDHGTLGEIFNKDKSSLKQLAWEASKMNDFHGKGKKGGAKNYMANKKGGKKFATNFKATGKVGKGKKFDGKKFVTQKPVNRKFQKRK